ncbi:hypothetical protein [Nocardia sp. NPDC057030]|uniref:hypothetical protein n=1 Tax=unclassified Nocardia TaxID=2637762 RepID=UPI00362BC14E
MAALLLVIMALFLMPEDEPPMPATDQHVRTLPYIMPPPTSTGNEMPYPSTDKPTPGRE